MNINVTGDKSAYQFLRALTGGSQSFRTEDLETGIFSVSGRRDNPSESELYSERIPLNTTLTFIPGYLAGTYEYSAYDKVLIFDEMPFIDDFVNDIIDLLRSRRVLSYEIILVHNNRMNIDSDISDENDAVKEALTHYTSMGLPVHILDRNSGWEFLFSGNDNTGSIYGHALRLKIDEVKEKLNSFQSSYERSQMIYLDIKKDPEILYECFAYDGKGLENNAIAYFTDNIYNKIIGGFELKLMIGSLYDDYIGSWCAWNMEKDKLRLYESIKNVFYKKFRDLGAVQCFAAGNQYDKWCNENRYTINEIRKRTINFVEEDLREYLFDFFNKRIRTVEEFLNEKTD